MGKLRRILIKGRAKLSTPSGNLVAILGRWEVCGVFKHRMQWSYDSFGFAASQGNFIDSKTLVVGPILLQSLILGVHGRLRNNSTIFGKFGVPNPVNGSHPSTAWNPSVLHPGLLPFLMSLRTSGWAYRAGLMKPTGDFPAASRSSLMRVTIDAKMGVPKHSQLSGRLLGLVGNRGRLKCQGTYLHLCLPQGRPVHQHKLQCYRHWLRHQGNRDRCGYTARH